MNKQCKHLHVEVHDYRPRISVIGYRCVDCQTPLMVKAGVHESSGRMRFLRSGNILQTGFQNSVIHSLLKSGSAGMKTGEW